VTAPIVRGIARDITESRRVEKALRESEARYRELFENSKDALYIHDLNGKYTSVNRAAEKLSGYPREEIIGRSFLDFVCPECVPQVLALLGEKPAKATETNYEVEIFTKEGQRIPVEVSSRLIRKDQVPVAIEGSVRDITEIKKAHEASRTYSRRLIEAQEGERRHISRELHDQIGQILTAVKINLYALQRKCDSPETRASIDDNLKVIDEAFAQVRNLSVDLRPLLLDDFGLVVALRWYLARQTNNSEVSAKFVSHALDDEDRFSSEVETACFRIVQEAVTNVIRHAGASYIFVSVVRRQNELHLLIRDDGVGFDLQALRNGASGTSTLGLRGMEERVQALRGTINIRSEPGKGTRIRARLPLGPEPG
jgi:PAS domain S-box-containing protein